MERGLRGAVVNRRLGFGARVEVRICRDHPILRSNKHHTRQHPRETLKDFHGELVWRNYLTPENCLKLVCGNNPIRRHCKQGSISRGVNNARQRMAFLYQQFQ
jgi:hypothetical protein